MRNVPKAASVERGGKPTRSGLVCLSAIPPLLSISLCMGGCAGRDRMLSTHTFPELLLAKVRQDLQSRARKTFND